VTRTWVALLAIAAGLILSARNRSLLWRIPAAIALAIAALILFALDDAWRYLKRLLRRLRPG
jgi:hypothetical protein